LIVDEAQNLSKKVLEEIRLLSGIETHKEKVLRIILAGQPELKDTLDMPSLKQLVQRVRLRFHIGPLDKSELREYIDHRLAIAGRDPNDLFAPDTFDLIHRYTGGVPRLINTLCDTALLCAFAEEKEEVTIEDVLSAINELDWEEHELNTGVLRKLSKPVFNPGTQNHVTALELRTEGETVSTHSFPPGRIIIGRSPDNEIYIKSKFVSRHHAQVVSEDDGAVVEDLNSTNGVFIGDKQVKKYRLSDGDVITLGVHDLVYRDLRQLEDDAPESTDDTFDEDLAANRAFDDTIAKDDATADATSEDERASNDEALPDGEESLDDEEPSAVRK
jgi:pSer/pThr/pTyr-binding forkhead associated (FHA) protein